MNDDHCFFAVATSDPQQSQGRNHRDFILLDSEAAAVLAAMEVINSPHDRNYSEPNRVVWGSAVRNCAR